MTSLPPVDVAEPSGRRRSDRVGSVSRGGFRRTLLVSLLAAAFLPLLLFGALALLQVDAAVTASIRGQVRTALDATSGLLRRDELDLEETTLSYATWPVLQEAVAAGDLAGLKADVVDFQVGLGEFDAVAIASGATVVSGGEAGLADELGAIARRAVAAAPSATDVGPGMIGLASGVYQVAAVPVIVDERVAGSVAMARKIDAETVVAIAQTTGFEVAVVSAAGGSPVVSDARLADAMAGGPTPANGDGVTIEDGLAIGRVSIADRSGAAAGTLSIGNAVDLLDVVADNLLVLVAGTLAMAAAGAAVLAWGLSLRLRRRTEMVAGWLDGLSAGGAPPQHPADDADLRDVSRAVDELAATLASRERRLRASLDELGRLSPRLGAPAVAEAGVRATVRVFGVDEVVMEEASGAPIARAGGPAGAHAEGAPAAEATPPQVVALVEVVGRNADDGRADAAPVTARLIARGGGIDAWEEPDRAIFELHARLLGIAIRDAELVDRTADRARELDRIARLQADFLRGVSHNLQQPLTTIRLAADDVAAGSDPIRLQDAAAHIRAESDRLARVVGQLLTMSRLDAGTIRVEAEPLAPGQVVRHAWESLRASRRFGVDDRAPGVLAIADRACVEQILWILLDNAIKYAPRGPIGVRLEPRPASALGGAAPETTGDARPAGAVAIIVTDAGPGVPADERDRIFQRFVRGSTSMGTDGTGLGLDVARGLARAMGGELAYRDFGPENGAFELLLPAEPDLGPA
jgi:signal transduction histidine kinase